MFTSDKHIGIEFGANDAKFQQKSTFNDVINMINKTHWPLTVNRSSI